MLKQPAWHRAAQGAVSRPITDLIVHCTATIEGRDHSAAEIRGWHKRQGWRDIGYHFVVRLDGAIEVGRPLAQAGAHVSGHNAKSIGITYVGGLDRQAKPKDTRTPEQKAALVELLRVLSQRWPNARIAGHRDYSRDKDGNGKVEPHEWLKACPCFDAVREYAWLTA